MSSLNKVMIIGRLGRDPEMRYTQAGKPVCSLNVSIWRRLPILSLERRKDGNDNLGNPLNRTAASGVRD